MGIVTSPLTVAVLATALGEKLKLCMESDVPRRPTFTAVADNRNATNSRKKVRPNGADASPVFASDDVSFENRSSRSASRPITGNKAQTAASTANITE